MYDIFIYLFNKEKIPCSSRSNNPSISLNFFEVRLNFRNYIRIMATFTCFNQPSLPSYVYYLIFFCPAWNAITMMTKISWPTLIFSNIKKKNFNYNMKWTEF